MSNFLHGRRGTLLAVLLFCLYLGYQFYERKHAADALRQETLEAAVPTVAVIHAKSAPPDQTLILPGNIQAWYQAPIYARVTGYIKMWYKDYGAEVKEGDLLAEINTPTLDARFKMAEAELEAQQAKYALSLVTQKRWVGLREWKAVSEQSISVKQADAKVEKAKVNAAQQNVNNFLAKIRFKKIVAPYAGVVTDRNVNVGDYVNEQGSLSNRGESYTSNLFTVADIHMMRLFVSVPENFGDFLKPGLTADVTVPQFPDRHYQADFLTTAKAFDPNTRTVITEFTIANDDKSLWPGSYANVRLTVAVNSGLLVIPSRALVFQEHATQVATVTDDNRIHFKSIVLGKIRNRTIEVKEGITENDRIVNNPSAALLEGDQVRIVTPAVGYELSNRTASEQQSATPPAVSK